MVYKIKLVVFDYRNLSLIIKIPVYLIYKGKGGNIYILTIMSAYYQNGTYFVGNT